MSDPAISAAGKVALVTGGGRGIGAAIAEGLLAIGAKVAVLDFDRHALDELRLDVLKIDADVAVPSDCAGAVDRVIDAYGSLDILISNAGLGMGMIREDHFDRAVRLVEIEPEQWRRMFEVNCMGAFLMARVATPHMVARRWGRVVTVTTSFFTMLNEGFAPYGPAKAALESASAIWAKEFRNTGVTVNVLGPGGPTDTQMVPESAPFEREALIPAAAMVPPTQWLASAVSDGVTGRRFVAALWDAEQPRDEAVRAAGAPIGWPDLTTNVVWPEG